MITHPLTFAQRAPGTRQKGMLAICLLSLCTLGMSLPASAQQSIFVTFDPPGSIGTEPTSINSAGVIIDAIRCARVARDRGLGGPLLGPSAYFMKSPPVQYHHDVARQMVEAYITG